MAAPMVSMAAAPAIINVFLFSFILKAPFFPFLRGLSLRHPNNKKLKLPTPKQGFAP